jgi:cytosine/adenosine deaminase-related metal-dependent hydrolase
MYKRHGVPVALGCDGPASNDGQDMLEAIKLATLLQTLSERDYRNWPSPYETIRMASQGGARGLGLEHELGTLETGKRADLVLYDLTALSILPHTDPVCQLVYGRAGSSLHTVFVGGRRVVQAGCLLTIDLDDLRRRVLARQDFYINERQPKFTLRASIEDRYRKVMNLP